MSDVVRTDEENENDVPAQETTRSHHEHVSAESPTRKETTSPPTDPEAQPAAPPAPYSIFTPLQKRLIVLTVSCAGFFSAVSSNIYFPALNTLAAELHVSQELINLTLTSYMVAQAIAPTLVGDVADVAGRRPALIWCLVVYIGANVGIALQDSYAALLVLRALQSAGSSATIALGSGVVADIATAGERGTYMGWATSGAMVGIAVGPVMGGVLCEYLGWRSIFWFLVITSAALLVPLVVAYPETCRKVVGNGSEPPQRWNRTLISYVRSRRRKARDPAAPSSSSSPSSSSPSTSPSKPPPHAKVPFPNPLHTLTLFTQKDVSLLLLATSLIFTAFYDIGASTPFLFAQRFGFDALHIGLAFLPFGLGCVLSPFAVGPCTDWNYRRVARRAGFEADRAARRRAEEDEDDEDEEGGQGRRRQFPIELARGQVAGPLFVTGVLGVVCYGWSIPAVVVSPSSSTSVSSAARLVGPLLLQFVIGFCLTGCVNTTSVWLVDLVPQAPATVTAANNLVRCAMGAWGTAVIIPMIKALGPGWAFTVIGGGVLVVVVGVLGVLGRKGGEWRSERRRKAREKARMKKEGERS